MPSSTYGSPGFEETPETCKGYYMGQGLANSYRKFRPTYPQKIFDEIIKDVSYTFDRPLGLAVDIACGSGQSTFPLSPHFDKVIGFDISADMIEEANKDPEKPHNVQFRVGDAMNLPLKDNSVQLVTIGTGLHWMVPMEDFFKEVKRVLTPGGCLAAYGYGFIECSEEEPHAELVKEALNKSVNNNDVNVFKSATWGVGFDLFKDLELPFGQFIRLLSICNNDAEKKIHYKFPLYLLVGVEVQNKFQTKEEK